MATQTVLSSQPTIRATLVRCPAFGWRSRVKPVSENLVENENISAFLRRKTTIRFGAY
jgi:hypothetical protein